MPVLKGDLVGHWSEAAEIDVLRNYCRHAEVHQREQAAEIQRLQAALSAAATSLDTLAAHVGKDELLEDVQDIRGYAANRAAEARKGLAAGDIAAELAWRDAEIARLREAIENTTVGAGHMEMDGQPLRYMGANVFAELEEALNQRPNTVLSRPPTAPQKRDKPSGSA
jgi:chromosome segregation ATPase